MLSKSDLVLVKLVIFDAKLSSDQQRRIFIIIGTDYVFKFNHKSVSGFFFVERKQTLSAHADFYPRNSDNHNLFSDNNVP